MPDRYLALLLKFFIKAVLVKDTKKLVTMDIVSHFIQNILPHILLIKEKEMQLFLDNPIDFIRQNQHEDMLMFDEAFNPKVEATTLLIQLCTPNFFNAPVLAQSFEYCTSVLGSSQDWRIKESILHILDQLSYRIMENKDLFQKYI